MKFQTQCIASLASTVIGVINRDPPLVALLTSLKEGRCAVATFFRVAQAKMGHMSPTTSSLEVICHQYVRTFYD